jgi:hypothetical protein
MTFTERGIRFAAKRWWIYQSGYPKLIQGTRLTETLFRRLEDRWIREEMRKRGYAIIIRKSLGEHRVRVVYLHSRQGQRTVNGPYFTDDAEDAKDTARAMLREVWNKL